MVEENVSYEWIGEIDCRFVGKGAFVSYEWQDFEILGNTVCAANFIHAEYLALKRLLKKSESRAEQSRQCDHCGAHLQYVVVLLDTTTGNHIGVGLDCAAYLDSGMKRKAWLEKRKEREIKEAKNNKFYHSRQAPAWIWKISPRPDWLKVSKSKLGKNPQWFFFVWGDSTEEVTHRLGELEILRQQAIN